MLPKKFKEFVEKQSWIKAKRYVGKASHEYLVKQRLDQPEQAIFVEFIIFIRDHGYKRKFNNISYIYYDIDNYKYWTMGAMVEKTIILNRDFRTDRKLNV